MTLRARLITLWNELGELIDELPGDERPTKRRRVTRRTAPKPAAIPNDLQRARAKRFLRDGGFSQ